MRIKCFFGFHNFEEKKVLSPGNTCVCGAWKMFHTSMNPPMSGDCGNYRPMIELESKCIHCGEHDREAEIHAHVFQQCQQLGIPYR